MRDYETRLLAESHSGSGQHKHNKYIAASQKANNQELWLNRSVIRKLRKHLEKLKLSKENYNSNRQQEEL